MNTATAPYLLSFTAAGALREDSVRLAELYTRLRDWRSVREHALRVNILQARKTSSASRIVRELLFRLQELSDAELELLVEGTLTEQNQLLWLAICRRYRLIAEFAREVVRERFLSFAPTLELGDFDSFFDRKADWAEELDRLAPVTRKKLRQVLFRMLREVGLLDAEGLILAALISDRMYRLVARREPQALQYFPVLDADLARRA